MDQDNPSPFSSRDFADAWSSVESKLRDWLACKRFIARPAEVSEVFEAAKAEVQRDDWRACRSEAISKPSSSDSADKWLMAAFSRAVRTIEIRKWSQLILGGGLLAPGSDHWPSGPLSLRETWRVRLPEPWNADSPENLAILQKALGELALCGWAALGGYGLHADTDRHFLERLQQCLRQHDTWEGVLSNAMVDGQRSLVDVLRLQALREFNDEADGERAFHWALEHLVNEKLVATGATPVREVSNPAGFLRAAFARALVDFRRVAWRPGQPQRPRPDAWMSRLLHRDWIDVFHLTIRHSSTQSVVERFLLGEQRGTVPDDPIDEDKPFGVNAKDREARMTDVQRRFQARAQQIEADFQGDSAARIQAIAAWCRSYLEQVKQWFPVASDVPLHFTDSDGEESERQLPVIEGNPLAELLCEEDRRRLLDRLAWTDLATRHDGSLEARLRNFIQAILGPEFALTAEEAAILCRIVAPPAAKRGRPPKAPEKERILVRLREAATVAGLDSSIFDSVSVIFPYWDDDSRSECIESRAEHAGAGAGGTP